MSNWEGTETVRKRGQGVATSTKGLSEICLSANSFLAFDSVALPSFCLGSGSGAVAEAVALCQWWMRACFFAQRSIFC